MARHVVRHSIIGPVATAPVSAQNWVPIFVEMLKIVSNINKIKRNPPVLYLRQMISLFFLRFVSFALYVPPKVDVILTRLCACAPYVCAVQDPAVDVWSAGVILLCLLSRRYPFFPTADHDEMAMVQIAAVCGSDQVGLLINNTGKCS